MSTSISSVTNDIATAICFAAKISLKPSFYDERILSEPLTPTRNPVYSGQSDDPSRLKRMLDSLAMSCVSEPQSQVVAVGLRVSQSEVQLLVAQNDDIAPKTVQHLEQMWGKLQTLSANFDRHHSVRINSPSPRQPSLGVLDPETQALVKDFHINSLKFGVEKLKKRLEKHSDAFKKLKPDPSSFFFEAWETLAVLYYLISIDEAPLEEKYAEIVAYLDLLEHEIEQLPTNYSDNLPSTSFNVSRYLFKVTSQSKDAQVLINAANSPRLRQIFQAKFTITPLEPVSETYRLPNATPEWKEVIQRVLAEKNRTKKPDEDEFELTPIAGQDAKQVTTKQLKAKEQKKPFPETANVHCECRIIQYTFEPGAPQIYSYIGCSKLSCNGCFEYIEAVNAVHSAQQFQTKGSHRKWYYPWAFAAIPQYPRVASIMYSNVAQKIGRVYPGFTAKSNAVLSDSDPQSVSSAAKAGISKNEIKDVRESKKKDFQRLKINW